MARWIALAAGLLLSTGCAAQGADPAAVGAGSTLFVANKQENSVSRIDLASGQEAARVPACANPHELALSPDARHLAVGCYGGSTLEIFRSADLQRVKRIELGAGARPHGLIWHSSGFLLASAEGRGSVFLVEQPLSAEPNITEIAAAQGGPHLVALSADGRTAWGTAIEAGEVVRIDLAAREVTHRRQIGGEPEAIALAPDGRSLWVGSNAGDKLYRLDPATLEIEAEIATGATPIRVAVSPDGAHVVTSNLRDGSLSVIDSATNRILRTIPVSGEAAAAQVTISFAPEGGRLYVAETGAGSVAEVDLDRGVVLRRLPAGEGGDGLAISP